MNDLKDLSFLIYGLGLTGKSVVKFFNKNRFKNYKVWDDTNKSLYNKKRPINLNTALKKTNYIILSPGVSLNQSKNVIARTSLKSHGKTRPKTIAPLGTNNIFSILR